jgi:Zn-dependent membrane protease YugP
MAWARYGFAKNAQKKRANRCPFATRPFGCNGEHRAYVAATMMFDPIYLLVCLPGLALSAWASIKVNSTFARYSQVRAQSGLTGAEAARELLRLRGVNDVRVEPVQGFLSDHYDPGARVLRLSPDVYNGHSLASLGVAAHEAGHALQHATGYGPLKFRSFVVKPAMLGSNLGMYVLMGGLVLNMSGLVWVGIAMFSAFVIFTLVTLPVEFNASSRAVEALQGAGMISRQEAPGTKAVLDAAALTYVAAAIGAVVQLVYLLWRAGVFNNRREQ